MKNNIKKVRIEDIKSVEDLLLYEELQKIPTKYFDDSDDTIKKYIDNINKFCLSIPKSTSDLLIKTLQYKLKSELEEDKTLQEEYKRQYDYYLDKVSIEYAIYKNKCIADNIQ